MERRAFLLLATDGIGIPVPWKVNAVVILTNECALPYFLTTIPVKAAEKIVALFPLANVLSAKA